MMLQRFSVLHSMFADGKPKWSIVFIVLFTLTSYAQKNPEEKHFSFGVIADCQYCDEVGTGVRKYDLSDTKLQQCVTHLNTMDLAYTVHLGDFIDKDWKSFDDVGPIYNTLKMPKYHVLGNHDFSVADTLKHKVSERMGLPSPYYDFEVNGWRFIVLNGNDVSFHAYPQESKNYKKADAYYTKHKIESPKWNGALGKKQLKWLKQVLESASKNEEKVILYCHFPVYPENVHNLWNADEVIDLIEDYSCVKTYINGHNHAGNYGQKNGIHYVTMKGMVDTEQTSYSTIKVYPHKLEIMGYGREENRTLLIKK